MKRDLFVEVRRYLVLGKDFLVIVFLPILSELQYGLTEEVLKEAFSQSAEDRESCWSLNKIPTIGFYRELHHLLKKWPPSCSATKTAIGKFYIQIDPELPENLHLTANVLSVHTNS